LPKGSQQRILIVRLGAMGDILHALPAVTALREAYPDRVIGWAVEPQWRALLCADSAGPHAARTFAQPLVDHVHPVPAKQWARYPLRPSTLASILDVRRELRGRHYDATLDLQGALRSAVVASFAKAERLLGEAEPRERIARHLFSERIVSKGVHVIDQLADVVRGLYGDALPLGLPWLPQDPLAAHWCTEAGAGPHFGPAILLHPGAGWGAKRWPVERYAQVGAMLARQTGSHIVINAAPGEVELGASLASHLHGLGVSPLLLSPTVGQLIELTRRMSLVIGGDTGPLHLAAALGKLTVGIYGPTEPARNGPYHGRFAVLRDAQSRRDHTRHRDPEAGLLRISPHQVLEAALALIGDGAHTSTDAGGSR
jgi:heptosyltransferase-1